MDNQKTVLEWLNDAYAMETSLIPTLRSHAESMPASAKPRLEQHARETERHVELLRGCIERLGGDVSAIQAGIANLGGFLKELPIGMAQDKIIKQALSDYAAEHFEIACYTSLIAAAQQIGDNETARVCQEILREEEAMASWLAEQLPMLTRDYLVGRAQERGA